MAESEGMTEGESAILAALTDLLAEVRALRADLAPKASGATTNVIGPWYSPIPQGSYRCATCQAWVPNNANHVCPGTTAGMS